MPSPTEIATFACEVQNVPVNYTKEDILNLHKSVGIDMQELWPGCSHINLRASVRDDM